MSAFKKFLVLVLGGAILWIPLAAAAVDIEFSSVIKDYHFSAEEQALIQSLANEAESDIRQLLPSLDKKLTLLVEASTLVIPDTGELGGAVSPGVVKWTVDPSRPGGVNKIAKTFLRHTLFHEFHHLARGYVFAGGNEVKTFMDAVLSEGLGTAFARDYSGADAPWAKYPPEAADWLAEVKAVKGLQKYDQWMFLHPDGRSWIGYKVGTYLVDQAMKASGKSTVELLMYSTDELIKLAESTQ